MSEIRYRPVPTDTPSDTSEAKGQWFRPPVPDPAPESAIALGVVLFVTGASLLAYGAKHLAGHIVRTDGAGWAFIILGSITFTPGAYVSAIALGTWLGFKGFTYSQIPT